MQGARELPPQTYLKDTSRTRSTRATQQMGGDRRPGDRRMIGLIGLKIGMTQLFSEQGEAIPVTVIEAGPCTVTDVRTSEQNGYSAIQLGFGSNKESRYTRPVLG